MRNILIFILLSFVLIPSFGNDDKREFDRDKWEDLKGDMDYKEFPEEQVEKEQEEDLPPERANQREEIEYSSPSGDGQIGNVLLYIFIPIIILGLVYLLISQFSNDTGIEIGDRDIKIDDDLDLNKVQKSELELKIEEALKNEDYRLAVRIYFLVILKSLSDKGTIQWQKRKTNHTYLREIHSLELKTPFSTVIRLFEVVWYGRNQIEKMDFHAVEPVFKDFLNKISNGRG